MPFHVYMSIICPLHVNYMSAHDMPSICPLHVHGISIACPLQVRYMSIICPLHVYFMSFVCPFCLHDMSIICQVHVCPRYAQYMSMICPMTCLLYAHCMPSMYLLKAFFNLLGCLSVHCHPNLFSTEETHFFNEKASVTIGRRKFHRLKPA